MTSTKRKDVDEKPEGNNNWKKVKIKKDTLGLQTTQGPDDEVITSLFHSLFYDINTFVQADFKGAPYVIPRKADQKHFFDSLTGSDYTSYVKSKHAGAKKAMIQAVIWNKLIDPLLSTPIKAFIDGMPELEVKTLMRTSDSLKEFCAWRSMTAHFLSNKKPVSWGEAGPKREEFVHDMAQLLFPLSVSGELDELESHLEGIADKAFELATAMARSRAGWVCTMMDRRIQKLHSFKIRKDRMEEVELWNEDEHSKSVIVDLVKTPMLLRWGNSDGGDYDQCQVVKKAQVITRAKEDTE